MATEDLVSIKEAAKIVPVAEKTLRNWRCQGLYPQIFVKLGGNVFIDISEVDKIVREQKRKAVDQSRKFGF